MAEFRLEKSAVRQARQVVMMGAEPQLLLDIAPVREKAVQPPDRKQDEQQRHRNVADEQQCLHHARAFAEAIGKLPGKRRHARVDLVELPGQVRPAGFVYMP